MQYITTVNYVFAYMLSSFHPFRLHQKRGKTVLSDHAVPSQDLHVEPTRRFCRVVLPHELKGDSIPCVYEVKINDEVSALLSFDATLFDQSGANKIAGFQIWSSENEKLRAELEDETKRNNVLESEILNLQKAQSYMKQNLDNLKSKNKTEKCEKQYWKSRSEKRFHQLQELRKRRVVTPISKTESNILSAVGKIFSPAQLRALASKNKRVKWSSDDIAMAISIRSKGSGCYSYIRALGLPFPDKSTICRWTAQLSFGLGLQEEILVMMKHQLLCVPLLSKLGGLCFDETNIDSRLQYDPSLDCILGYCSGMLVVMLRALADSWKQPIYYTFEKNITSEILMNIIVAVERAGISVRSITCDMAGGNRSISYKHTQVEGRERQRVIYAVQLFSKSVSTAFDMIFDDMKDVARFIAIINDWFDVFNSRRFDDKARKPFGLDLDNQLRVLNLAYEEISSFRALGKRTMLPFQKGMLIDITSLQGLYLELIKEPTNQKFILTKVLLQDALENCFSIMRSMGEYHDCPNAYEARCRLKNVMFGWNFRQHATSVSTSIEDTGPSTFLSTLLLSSLKKRPNTDEVEDEFEYVGDPSEFETTDENKITDSNWEEYMKCLDNSQKCEFGGKEYIYGFIARKLEKKYPDMALARTRAVEREPKSWVQRKSNGGLTIPSYDWINTCEKLDKVFVKHHDVGGDIHINQAPGARKGLAAKMHKLFPEVPFEAIRLFVRTRCNIRIKHVNQQIIAGRLKRKKKSGQFAKSSMRLRSSNNDEESSVFERGIEDDEEGWLGGGIWA